MIIIIIIVVIIIKIIIIIITAVSLLELSSLLYYVFLATIFQSLDFSKFFCRLVTNTLLSKADFVDN